MRYFIASYLHHGNIVDLLFQVLMKYQNLVTRILYIIVDATDIALYESNSEAYTYAR